MFYLLFFYWLLSIETSVVFVFFFLLYANSFHNLKYIAVIKRKMSLDWENNINHMRSVYHIASGKL